MKNSAIRFTATLLAIASVAIILLQGCTLAQMSLDSEFESSTTAWDVHGRQGKFTLPWNALSFDFGPYSVSDAQYGAISTEGSFLEILFLPSNRLRQATTFDLVQDGDVLFEVGCVARASEELFYWPHEHGQYDCALQSTWSGDTARLGLDFEDRITSDRWVGSLTVGSDVYRVRSQHSYEGTFIPSMDAIGFLIETDYGDPIAAVETMNDGRVWISEYLRGEDREAIAAAAGALLLFQDVREYLGYQEDHDY